MMLVATTKGDVDDSLLEKREGVIDNEVERTTWIEYWMNDELVHRSVHVTLKQSPTIVGETATIG